MFLPSSRLWILQQCFTLTDCSAPQARRIFNAWSFEAETTKMYVERCERMLQARDVVTSSNVVYWWHSLTFQVFALPIWPPARLSFLSICACRAPVVAPNLVVDTLCKHKRPHENR